jgi:bifunctional non-homologous end joining protein LigD
LPSGTLLDGELVAFTPEGRPELPRLLRRHGLTSAWRLRQARRWGPVLYMVFDLLYLRGRSLLGVPLARRRAALAALCAGLDVAEVLFSAGVVGAGTALYALALARGHEGVVAKHLASTYRPGRRSPAWRKLKPRGHANRLEG